MINIQVGVAIRSQKDLNELLEEIISQAEALGIPVSSQINSDVVVNQRARSRFGCCKIVHSPTLRTEHGHKIEKSKKNQIEKPDECQSGPRYIIEISAALSVAPIDAIKEVLAHEVLHTTPGGDRHTGPWKKYASMMNQSYGYHIKRTNSPESLGVSLPREKPTAKYLIICKKCGMTQERSRISKVIKHPSLYRCKCGGKLKIKTAQQ